MNNLDIDTEQLQEKISRLKEINKTLEEIFKQIKDNTENLKDYWDTQASESVFTSFQEFYNTLESVKNNLEADVKFLENKVNPSYIAEENRINKVIDEKIAI